METWINFLTREGALTPDTNAPTQAAQSASAAQVMMPLTHWHALTIRGADARAFLHGQCSSNVQALATNQWQFSSYNTPKGRALAVLRLAAHQDESFTALIPADISAGLLKRLRLYVLRAKVSLQESETVLIGCAGTEITNCLQENGFLVPQTPFSIAENNAGQVWHMGKKRFIVVTDVETAMRLWTNARANGVHMLAGQTWEYAEIQAGWPTVFAATQEAFVPQMLNLEQLGGIAFNKGCYPGQEIVARTHYLGKVKRELRLARSMNSTPALGTELFVTEHSESAGQVVNAHPHPDGGALLLVVVRSDWCMQQNPQLGTPMGETIQFLPFTDATEA